MSVSWGLLLVRLVVGFLLVGHGSQKLFGWFGGVGLRKSISLMQAQHFRPAEFWAVLGGAGEFGGGLLFMAGFLWPLGPIAILAAMLMAVVRFHLPGTLFGAKGFEYPLLLLLLSGIVGLVGPGRYALDAALGLHLPTTLLFWVGLAGAVIVDAVGYAISQNGKQAQSQPSVQG
jgi:putative oxidoreductase